MKLGRILLVGEVVVDVTLLRPAAENKLRLGGVFHAARALWAIGADYEIACFCPTYVDRAMRDQASKHGARLVTTIGEITGSPNVMLIAEATEAGDQGYDHLLRDEYEATFYADVLKKAIDCGEISDVLVLSGNFPLKSVLALLGSTSARIHVDLGNGPSDFADLGSLGRNLATLFLSTSARTFPLIANDLPQSAQASAGSFAESIVLKENRGGARVFNSDSSVVVAGSQRREIVHSVGVGDAFDAIWVFERQRRDQQSALHRASWIAAEYAATTFPDDFKRACIRTLGISDEELSGLQGVSLPWERRSQHQIYIAAPDFDYMDRRHIDGLVACLRYHNFSPRLPVRENGQANESMSRADRQRLFDGDVTLLRQCSLLIAVTAFEDPGTHIEIGLAHAWGIPVIVYDPYARARNVMLTELPELVSSSLDRIVTATFDHIARKCREP